MPSALAGSRSRLRREPSGQNVDVARLYVWPSRRLEIVTRAPSNIDAIASFGAGGSLDRASATVHRLDGFYTRQDHPELLRRIRFKDWPESRQDDGLHRQQLAPSKPPPLRALQKPLAGGTLLQVDQAASSDQAYGTSENAVKTQIWIAVPTSSSAIVKKRLDLDASNTWSPILSVSPSSRVPTFKTCGRRKQMQRRK